LTVVVERLCQSFVGALEGGKLALPHSRTDALASLWDEADERTEEISSQP
jgi:hypothetical protein